MKTMILLVVSLALASLAFGGEDSSPSLSLKSNVLSAYVDKDGQVYYNDPIVETTITKSLPLGFYVEVVDYLQTKGHPSFGTEIDTSVGWALEGKSVDLDVGVSYFDLNSLFRGSRNNVWVGYLKASKTFEHDTYGKLTPSIELSRFKATGGSDFEGGFRGILGAEYAHKLFSADLTYNVSLVRDDGTYGSLPAWVNAHALSLGWKLGKVTLNAPVISVTIPVSSNSGRPTKMVTGFGLAYDF